MPIFAAASLLIHIGVIGALIADFRSSQGKARRSPATAIEVEVVHDPLAALLKHPALPNASERALLSRGVSEASLVPPRSAEPVSGSDHADGRGKVAAAAEPRRSDDLKATPLDATAGEQALLSQGIFDVPLVPTPSAAPVMGGDRAESRGIVAAAVEPRRSDDLDVAPMEANTRLTTPTGNRDLVLATTAFDSVSARNLTGAFALVEASWPIALSPRNAIGKSLFDWSPDRPPFVAASSPAAEAAAVVGASEPSRSGDLNEASLGVGAAAPAPAGGIDLVLPGAASDRLAPRSLADAPARIEMSAPATPSVENGGSQPPSDWPGADLRPTTVPFSASDAGVVVAAVEPRRSDDLKEAPLRRSAALLVPAGPADNVLRASLAPMPELAPTLVGLPAQSPLASEVAARSVTSDAARRFAMATPAAATTDDARTLPAWWDSADLRADPVSPAAELGEIAIDGRPLAIDSAGDRGAPADTAVAAPLLVPEAGAVVSPVATVTPYDERPAPGKPASDDVASIFPAPLVTKRTTTIPAVVTIPILRPSTADAMAAKDEESQAALMAGGSLALGGLDAPWAPWGVQIASSFSLDQALASFAAIQHQFPGASIQPPLVMRNVDRSRGWAPLYQIRIPATDQESAKSICSRLEAAKGACVVLRN